MPAPPTRVHASRLAAIRKRIAEWKVRLDRQIVLRIEHARASLGIRRGLHLGGVYYKELSAQRLARSLTPRGGGAKDYRVTFPDGSKQIIRCTRDRCYADLMGPEQIHRLERIAGLVRPGSRVLEIAAAPMVTGYSGAWLANMVGPSGAVVSLIGDEEGARFASARHARPNLSIERLSGPLAQALAGETDSAFHGVVHLDLPENASAREAVMRELWRVLAPGGWMLVGVRIDSGITDATIRELIQGLAESGATIESPAPCEAGPVLDVVLTKQIDAG